MSLHRLAEERSLAYHGAVARRLREEPGLLEPVRIRLDRWMAEEGRASPYAREWREIVDLPLQDLLRFLVDPCERARELRQSTPFAGMLKPRERWRLWREVRQRLDEDPQGGDEPQTGVGLRYGQDPHDP